MSLVLENKVSQAINIIKVNSEKTNSDFFEAYLLLALNSLKKNDFDQAINFLSEVSELLQKDRFNYVILNSLKQYLYVFKENKILESKENFGNFTLINETFQRCYLADKQTDSLFSNLIILLPCFSSHKKNFLSKIKACLRISAYPQIISLWGKESKKFISDITKSG